MAEKHGMAEWRKIEDGLYHCPLPSTEEMFRRVKVASKTPGAEDASTRSDSGGWYGGMGVDDAFKAATQGWSEGAKLVREAAQRTNMGGARFVGEKRALQRRVAGNRVDLGAYNHRRPACMIKRKVVRTNDGSVVTVGVDAGALGNVNGEEMRKRSVAIATVVNAIENMGVSCQVVAMHTVSFGPGREFTGVVTHVTKKANFPVNLERLAFGLGHPAVHRRGVFGVRERFPEDLLGASRWGQWWYGYGSTRSTPDRVTKALGVDYHIPSYGNDGIYWYAAEQDEVDRWCEKIYNEIFAAKMKGVA